MTPIQIAIGLIAFSVFLLGLGLAVILLAADPKSSPLCQCQCHTVGTWGGTPCPDDCVNGLGFRFDVRCHACECPGTKCELGPCKELPAK